MDEYLTKPFHAEELIKRLNNLLQIRAIVAKNNLAGFEAGEVGEQMSERDRAFTKNLQQVLAQEYANSAFSRTEMASKLAVSERQLQRKTTALFHQSPSALLRIYRLHQAQALLKQGNRVGEVADACGFTSHSQFSQHYRKQFGTSPKTHQVHQ